MKLNLILIFLSFIPVVQSACNNVDLNIKSPLKEMPILDQDGVGLCYAYAAEQLIEYKLRSEKSPLIPSALDLSLRSASFYRSELEGGFVDDLIEEASEIGIVEKSCIENQIKSYTGDAKITTEQYNLILHEMYNYSTVFASDELERAQVKKKLKDDYYLGQCKTSQVLDDIYKRGQWGDSVISILKIALNPCEKKRKKIGKLDYDSLEWGSDTAIKNKLDNILGSKKPASVSLCAEALEGPGSTKGLRGLSPPLFRGSNGNRSSCSGHALLAVGSRQSGAKCQYLIRNSWGGYWVPDGVSCACKTSKKYYPDCPDFSKLMEKAGTLARLNEIHKESNSRVYVGCWFDSNKLVPNLMEVGSIK